MPTTTTNPNFVSLLDRALTEPGLIHSAYFAFHGYSIGNQMLAMIQCQDRGIVPGPIACFNRWKELGRHVMKGQKAIELCLPVTSKRTVERTDDSGNTTTDTVAFRRFIFRRNWFVLSQTDGQPYTPPALPDWNKARALAALDITEIPFTHLDGNVQGFARGRSVAVSPVAAQPEKTLFHELAHVVLGHTAEAELTDDERTPRTIREVQAEGVALLVAAALSLPGTEFSIGYIQHWKGQGGEITDKHAQQIFKAADAILRAGRQESIDDAQDPVDDSRERDTDR
jgi:antirestriction protein ArdC